MNDISSSPGSQGSSSSTMDNQELRSASVSTDGFPDVPEVVRMEPVPKKLRRERFLRGLQGLTSSSSSPTLNQFAHSRSYSSPYNGAPSFSCASLASNNSPFANGITPFDPFTPTGMSTAPTSQAGTPGLSGGEGYFDGVEIARRSRATSSVKATTPLPVAVRPKKVVFNIWARLPYELALHVLSFLQPKELVKVSRTSKGFHKMCFDGQLWTSFDASEFYREIPAASLAKIIIAAGPFVKDLNLRGCVQVEHYKRAEIIVNACKNLINATLEGCRNLQRQTLHTLLKSNGRLAYLNLTGLTAVTNSTCKIIAQNCPSLETFNVSWCKHMDAKGLRYVVDGCPKLMDIRAGEVKGFDNEEVAEVIFRTNNLERLVLSGCSDLSDAALQRMMHGKNPEIDILTGQAVVPARKLRHLDLARCTALTSISVRAVGHLFPDLEGLSLSGCTGLTDRALEPIFVSSHKISHLDLEDVPQLTNQVLSQDLAKSACIENIEHLCISHCEGLGDAGVLPILRRCKKLTSLHMDNTNISDLVLAEAAAIFLLDRTKRTEDCTAKPFIGLSMMVYDCPHITWTGVREVLSRNAEISAPRCHQLLASPSDQPTYPLEIIGLKCFYGWQMTVDEHTKRVLKGDLASAKRLERKWADYMQANLEAGMLGSGIRRRRRRAREAQAVHADEEDGGVDGLVGGSAGGGRRRARTIGCTVM